ncbi:hypothetical protein [Glycomyces tenuis]|nr:hypothetical protein [Glycomyces tenuis]
MGSSGRSRRRRFWFTVVTGAVVSGAVAGAGAWFGRAKRTARGGD